MRTRTFMLAAVAVALCGAGQAAYAQFGNMGPAAPYPAVMAPTYMPENGYGPSMGGPQGPYAAPAFSPASYAGMGGPAPMGGAPMGPGPMPAAPAMTPMAPMPAGIGSPGYGGDYGPISGGDFGGGYAGLGGDGGYGDGGYCPPAGPQGWSHHYFGFGDFLYLRPTQAEVAYAVPINAAAAGAATPTIVQTGRVHAAEGDYAPAFRVGFGGVVSPRTAFQLTYTQFDRGTIDTAAATPGNVIRSLVQSPNPLTGAADGIGAAAELFTEFRLIDADMKGLLIFNPEWQVNYVVGARYGNLEQHLLAGFATGVGATGVETVAAEVEFDGGGPRLGMEAMRFHPRSQFFWFGRGYSSFLAGTFRARYSFDNPGAQTATTANLNVGRIVTMLDLETGLGWQNFTGNVRFSGGYMLSAWSNTVRLNDYINAVQANNFIVPSDNLRSLVMFDGVMARVEVLW